MTTLGASLSIGTAEILLRLTVAVLAGCVLGLNRELKDKPAGMRTHALVTLGAALATMMVVPPATNPMAATMDALSRVVQGVLTGIGFLGGGVILRDATRHRIRGLTTAATIWVAASLGVACGVGYWLPVATAIVLTLIVLTFGKRIELWADKLIKNDDEDEPPSG